MKNHWILFLGSALLLTACSQQEEGGTLAGGKPVSFTLDAQSVITRTSTVETTAGSYVTEFVAGSDQVGIYATGAATATNTCYTVAQSGNNGLTGGTITIDDSGSADFHAYSPYTAAGTAQGVTHTVATDQSDAALYNASNFLSASTTGITAKDARVTLHFLPRLALVRVQMAGDLGLLTEKIVLKAKTGANWSATDDSVTPTGSEEEIVMHRTGEVYTAFVPGQQIAAGTQFLVMYLSNGKIYQFKPNSSSLTLTGGKLNRLKITMNSSTGGGGEEGGGEEGGTVEVETDLTIGDWGVTDISPDSGDISEVKPTTLMELTDFESITYTDIAKTKEEITSAGWWRFNYYADEEIDITSDAADASRGKVMHLLRHNLLENGTVPWHTGAFYYCVNKVMKGRYRLSFKAKSTEAATMAGNQLRIGAYMQEFYVDEADGKTKNRDYFAIIERNGTEVTTVYSQVLTYDSYQEYSIDFNLGKVSTIHTGTAASVTEESKSVPTDALLQKVVLYISCNKIDIDFWIDDMRWEPIE